MNIENFKKRIEVRHTYDCWPWRGAKKPTGYGNVLWNGKHRGAHIIAWEIENFPVPNGYVILHLCDNPSCCNPCHLVLGTNKSNLADMAIKGRAGYRRNRPKGVTNGNSKLTERKVFLIRKSTASVRKIAERFGISRGHVHAIKTGKSWKHTGGK